MVTNILVVDDSPVERVLVESLLRRHSHHRVQLAADGRQGLEAIAANPPELVITDLVMPEMDGLELVRTIRRRYPEIPVILMTAYGDESTCVAALEAGAASYVPKSQKAEHLLSAVERVLEFARANRNRRRLAQHMLEYHCRFSLENDPRLVRSFVAEIQRVLTGVGFGDVVERIRVSEALEEAILHGMYHGNLEITKEELARIRSELDDQVLDRLVEERCRDERIADRRILVIAHIKRADARFVIRDEGSGVQTTCVTGRPSSDDMAAGRGRGTTLMRSLMDDVTFNATGNELVMRRHL